MPFGSSSSGEESSEAIDDWSDTNEVKPSAGAGGAITQKAQSREKTIEERYQKKSPVEHVLLRPDTYVGSLEAESTTTWTWSDEEGRMVHRSMTIIPAMFKIFDEILVNAADVKAREQHERKGSGAKYQRMTKIEVEIDEENATISVLNDGSGIPVEIHKEHKVYVPELIFGQLLTSDNYDDSDQRVTGGRNGYGAKLTNIFSERFEAEVVDSSRRKKFYMRWTNNMSQKSDPKITETSLKGDYVKITFRPDLKRFKTDGLGTDLVSLMKKRVYDVAGTTGVRVSLNGKKLNIKDFKSYVDLYFLKPKTDRDMIDLSQSSSTTSGNKNMDDDDDDMDDSDFEGASLVAKGKSSKGGGKSSKNEKPTEDTSGVVKIHEKVNERWEVVVSQSDGQFQQVSFVNSICTTKGGTHVNYVIEPLVAAILKKVTTKNKGGIELKGHHVRQHIFIFVNCLVVNPVFDSQTKETLTLKPSQFGSTCVISDKTINAVVKSPITETVLLWAQTKQQVDLKRKMKSGGAKARDRILGIPKLEDANEAGGRRAHECTLILTEGDSAKTSCLAGLAVVGRDRYGVFPLRGKLLNVRDAGFRQLTENKELQNILTITGLEVGKKYVDAHGLRYGSIMIMTDQDHDGSHIKGLVISFLEHYWPDLLRKPGFLKEFVTPIVKVFRRKGEELAFFTIPEYENWKKANEDGKGWKVKYYKGLGTSDDKEFKRYFMDLADHQLSFDYEDDADFEAIDMAFNPKRAEDRKNWIQSFQEGTFLDHREKTIRYKDFVNKELVLFSKYDTERSIPSLMDGLKPAQRKVLFAVFKKGLVKSEMKVAQLASYTAEHSCYHHGEESLAGTIVNMAQTFCGSNNLNMLEPCGQFGSRKEGGKDSSAARYIYTKLSITARAMFVAADDEILTYNKEEGRVIEPKWYVPCIPLVLVNGAEGIGTGWSSSVPNYNPRDLIQNIRHFIHGEPMVEMKPWYRGFIGRIEKLPGKGYESVGLIEKIDDETLVISELPVRQWTQPYKEMLEEWVLKSSQDANAAGEGATGGASGRGRGAPKAKAKAKSGAGRGRGGVVPSVRAVPSDKYPIIDYRDNSTPDRIHFTIKMDPAYLALAESEGLEKIFKLRKAINTTNMTLFDSNGLVTRFDTELDILREFAKVRLEYYHKRKRHIINIMQKELCLLSNKTRFVLEVVEGELVVHKKKRTVLVAELQQRGYDTISQILQRYNTVNETMQGDVGDDGVVRDVDEKEEDEQHMAGTKEYDYLLGMALWSLTYERVEELKRQRQEREQELEIFQRKSPELLWEEDLDKLEAAIDQYEAQLAQDQENDKEMIKRASLRPHAKPFGRTAASRGQTRKAPAPKVKKEESKPPSNTVKLPSPPPEEVTVKRDISSPPKDFSLMERLRRKIAMNQEAQQPKVVQSKLDSLFDSIGMTASIPSNPPPISHTVSSSGASSVRPVEKVAAKETAQPVDATTGAAKRPLAAASEQPAKRIKKASKVFGSSSEDDSRITAAASKSMVKETVTEPSKGRVRKAKAVVNEDSESIADSDEDEEDEMSSSEDDDSDEDEEEEDDDDEEDDEDEDSD